MPGVEPGIQFFVPHERKRAERRRGKASGRNAINCTVSRYRVSCARYDNGGRTLVTRESIANEPAREALSKGSVGKEEQAEEGGRTGRREGGRIASVRRPLQNMGENAGRPRILVGSGPFPGPAAGPKPSPMSGPPCPPATWRRSTFGDAGLNCRVRDGIG